MLLRGRRIRNLLGYVLHHGIKLLKPAFHDVTQGLIAGEVDADLEYSLDLALHPQFEGLWFFD